MAHWIYDYFMRARYIAWPKALFLIQGRGYVFVFLVCVPCLGPSPSGGHLKVGERSGVEVAAQPSAASGQDFCHSRVWKAGVAERYLKVLNLDSWSNSFGAAPASGTFTDIYILSSLLHPVFSLRTWHVPFDTAANFFILDEKTKLMAVTTRLFYPHQWQLIGKNVMPRLGIHSRPFSFLSYGRNDLHKGVLGRETVSTIFPISNYVFGDPT